MEFVKKKQKIILFENEDTVRHAESSFFKTTMKLKLYFILNYGLMDINKINVDVINYNIATNKLS